MNTITDADKILRQALIAKEMKKIVVTTYRVIDFHNRVQSLMTFNFILNITFCFLLDWQPSHRSV